MTRRPRLEPSRATSHRPVAPPGELLIERGVEVARVGAIFDGLLRGQGAALRIDGEAGVGKTSFLASAAMRAELSGVRVLRSHPDELSHSQPYAVVRQLLRDVASDEPQRLRGPARAAEAVLLGGPPPETARPDAAIVRALTWLLTDLAAEHPLVLAVDDAHAADEASLEVLGHLVRRLHAVPLVALLAVRLWEQPIPPALIDPRVQVMHLECLSPLGSAELLRRLLGEVGEETTTACHSATGGNPLFLCELAAELRRRGIAHSVSALGEIGHERLMEWTQARIRSAAPRALTLARALAVVGADAGLDSAAAVAGVALDEAVATAAALVRAGVLEDSAEPRFRHPVLLAAVYGELTEVERADWHRKAALELRHRAVSAHVVAAHALRALRAGDPRIVEVLTEAARWAFDRGDARSAVSLLRRALDEPPEPNSTPEITLRLAEAERRAGAHASAADRLAELLPRAGSETPRVAILLARALGEQGRWVAALQLLVETRARIHDPTAALEVDAQTATWSLIEPGGPELDLDRLDRYGALAGDTTPERQMLAALARLRWRCGRPARDFVPLARRALRDGRLFGGSGLDPALWLDAVAVLVGAERLDDAEAAAEAALDDARTHGAPLEYMLAASLAACLDRARGRLPDAEAHARMACDLSAEYGWSGFLPWPEVVLTGVLVDRGQLDEAEALLGGRDLLGLLPETVFHDEVRLVRASLRLARGQREAAAEDCRSVARAERERHQIAPTGPWRLTLALALLPVGRDEARRLATEELRWARRWGARGMVGASMRVLGATTGGDDGREMLKEAVRTLGDSPRRLEHARALLDLGSAHRRAGHRRMALPLLREAADVAHRCGAGALAQQAMEEQRVAGARPRRPAARGPESLTPMERRIAALARDGLTNRQIAEQLFVTRKNVEMHLSRAYGKLGIASRQDLAETLPGDVG